MIFESKAIAAAVCLFSGLILPAYAQRDDKQGENQGGKRSEGHAQQAKPQQPERTPQVQQAPQQRRAEQPQQQQRSQTPRPQPQQRAQQPQESVPQAQQQPQRTQQVQQRAQQPQQSVPQAQQQSQRTQQVQQQRAQQQQQRQQQQPEAQQRSILSQPQPQRTRQQAQSWQQQRGWLKQGGWQGHDNFQEDSSRNWSSEHRTWAQRGGYGGYYIPQNTFSLYFGRQHFFRFRTSPVMYLGYPRFEYEGTSFLLLDPWPANWSQDWYASDDLYIDYDDGYYLYNTGYPQQRLAITILV